MREGSGSPDAPPDHHTASSDALRAALATLSAQPYAIEPADLQQRMCNVVDALRARGMAPEHVIPTVKGIAYESHLPISSGALVEKLVKWCVEQYFKES
jgi:hypothetical protein